MQYLPARCDACSFVMLAHHHAQGVILTPCPKCGAETSVFPGAKHHARERALFDELSEVVHSTVSPHGATLFLAGIEDLGEDAPALILNMVAARMPALTQLVTHARFLTSTISLAAMLLTMLRARSSMRSHSGFVVACGSAAADETMAAPASDLMRKSS